MDIGVGSFTGDRKNGRPDGKGEYTFPTGSKYVGEMKDGLFHGKGVLHFPNGSKYEAVWEKGRVQQGTLFFADGLQYQEKDWDYCTEKDRRFYHERHIPAAAVSTDKYQPPGQHPPHVFPDGCYDCEDGFCDPDAPVVTSYAGTLLRNADDPEQERIIQTCPKACVEPLGIHPEKSFPTQPKEGSDE